MHICTMMQGDTYGVFVSLRLRETPVPITPELVSEIELLVGQQLRKTYSEGQVLYDSARECWYFVPTQEETLAMEPGMYEVQVRVKFRNDDHSPVKGVSVGTLLLKDAVSGEVI